MKRQVVLTVSESKRLIARAVAGLESVQHAQHEGILVLCTGTTNGYIAEELLGKPIDKRAYRTGTTAPAQPERLPDPAPPRIPDMVWRNGRIDPELDRFSAIPLLKVGDVFIKGANALDYRKRQAGILIGDGNAGTIGAAIGRLIGSRVQLIIPVGLEKLVYHDMQCLWQICSTADYTGPRFFPVNGNIVTEIEALNLLTGSEATLLAAGGIAGAEGAVRLLIEGNEECMSRTLQVIDSIQGEPRFLL